MINDDTLAQLQCQQVLEMFSVYLNDINFVINKVKKSIYEINNIQMSTSEILAQPNVASLTLNGKKTLDDLKRIASILRGYSRSKNLQRQEEQTRRSRIQNSSISRQSRSKASRYSNVNSSNTHSRISKIQSHSQREQISMVTFQVPPPESKKQQKQADKLLARLKNYNSMKSLNHMNDILGTVETMQENYQPAKLNSQFQNGIQDSPIHRKNIYKQSPMQRKRARTFQNSVSNKSISRVITQTETKFKQCLEKHDSGLDDIIKRNTECLQILKDIRSHLKNKKNRKNQHFQSSPVQILRKASPGYKSMTPNSKKQHVVLVK